MPAIAGPKHSAKHFDCWFVKVGRARGRLGMRCTVVTRNDVERRSTSFGLEVGHNRSGSVSFRDVHLAPNCGWILVFFL